MRFSLYRLLRVWQGRSLSGRPGPTLSSRPAAVQALEARVLLSADPLIGDANNDGRVDQQDVDWIRSHWNLSAGNDTAQPGDIDGDGFVGLGDLNLVLGSPDFDATPVRVQPAQSQLTAAGPVTNGQVISGYYTDFNGTISGNWIPDFDRDQPTVDPFGNLVAADQPRWGEAVGVSAAQAWELVLARNNLVHNIGYGPGADGDWLSIWFDGGTDEFIAFNHDLTQWKTLDVGRDGAPTWLDQSDWEPDTRYIPKTGQIVPGGLWVTYLQRDDDLDPTAGRDWTPVGTSFGVVQEVTFDNVFTQQRTILDNPRAQGLIDSETGEPYPNIRGREWAMSLTPIVVDGRVEKVWYTFTDYMQDVTVPVHKPGGTTWVFLAERDAVGDHYTIRQPRVIEQQEDPLGKDEAFEHRHSAITVVHETGEVDVIVASGDTAPHSFTKRYRIDDPDNYETSTLTAQLTGFLGITGEVSPKLISFQVGSAANKVLAATDGRMEGVVELTIPVDITAPAIVRSIIGRGLTKSAALTVNLEAARPWERSGYAVSVRPFNNLTPSIFPVEASTFFYSEDGETWIEIASNIGEAEIVFHDDILVTRNANGSNGIFKMPLSGVGVVNPLLISPGGTQRLAETLTEHTAYDDTEVTFLEKVGGLWVDDGVPLPSQPPSFGHVIRISRTGELNGIDLTRLLLAGANADFEAGGYAMKAWVMAVPGYSPYINSGLSSTGFIGDIELYQPTTNQGWHPLLAWDNMDPNGDGSDYLAIARLTASFVGQPHHTEFYIAYDLLLNQADNPGTVAPIGDINNDAFVGIDDLTALLTDWNKSTIPTVIPGDFNEDGFVGISDLNIVLSNWNSNVTPGDLGSGDGTGDGFVGIEDLNFVLSKWNEGVLPQPLLPTDVDRDGFVGISDLNALLGEWNVYRPTTGLVPGYSILPSDTQNIDAEPEKLTWDLPAPTNDRFTVAVAMTIPQDGIDGSWGEDDFSNGSTNYGTLYYDENNYIELWNHRTSRTWSVVVVSDGNYAGSITLDDAWVNVDGRLHWALSYHPTAGLRFALLHRGNEVVSGTLNTTLGFMPSQLRIGSHDWLSVPTVGVKSAYYDPTVGESIEALTGRVFNDAIYLG